MILVDTSVWIDFFNKTSSFPQDVFRELLIQRRVVTCRAVYAEIMSGKMDKKTRQVISAAFSAIPLCDPDWNDKDSWKRIVDIAAACHEQKVLVPGLVDRMIAFSAEKEGAKVWTFDKIFKKYLVSVNLYADPLVNSVH